MSTDKNVQTAHSIHGNWQEIYANYLEWHEGENMFSPGLEWTRPRPQILSTLSIVTIETLRLYFHFMGGDTLETHFQPALSNLKERID